MMYLPAIIGAAAGAVTGVAVGNIAFDSMITGIALAVAFASGMGGVLYAITFEQD